MTTTDRPDGRTDPGPWCLRCGGPADQLQATLDPRHPIGTCHPTNPTRKGCGRQVTTYSEAERAEAELRRRQAVVTSFHRIHRPAIMREPLCARCMVLPPGEAELPPGTDAPTAQAGAVQPGRRP